LLLILPLPIWVQLQHLSTGGRPEVDHKDFCKLCDCQELTTLWVARLDDGAELKVTDPKEQQGDVEEEEAKG